MTTDALIDELVNRIEQTELTSLQWGYVDGSLSEQQVLEMAENVAQTSDTGITADELYERLIDHQLIFELESSRQPRIRSRFAEGVRLLTRLRQLFPQRPWTVAPELVSDFRVDVRARLVPRREFASNDVLEALALEDNLQRDVASALLADLSLSRFQLDSTQHLLGIGGRSAGMVVCAGTGSGKTLSFYLPALVSIAAKVERDDHWVKALAMYPRRELLKDQMSEVFRRVRALDAPLARHGRRPIRIGSFFGLTPRDAKRQFVERAGWKPVRGGYICPYLTCPLCRGEMIWSENDLSHQRERLACRNGQCRGEATDETVCLTRASARKQPPDITFTTLEMVHQRLSDPGEHPVLGLTGDPRTAPLYVLLDEIHTYEGATGAQSALVLRRWRHAIGQPVPFVGLSATLREAPRFFAQLTGLDEDSVVEVSPQSDDLRPIGAAYQLMLRGNPVAQTPLLSTSIQAAVLLARLMDTEQKQASNGRFGRRIFVFTDDLDVTNRLFDYLRDAEAYDMFGRPDSRRQPLASLRGADRRDAVRRQTEGQNWRSCERLGWQLHERLRITRTTSQDEGVENASEVVVATSSLEVGFDDARVGAVMQHKGPMSMASFLQRRGRAGRPITMRPWMVTILSDYGRDRLTYQAYEQLFDPALPPQNLPVTNRHILRMQAVSSFIDWMASLAAAERHPAWWWRVLNGPSDDQYVRSQQEWTRRLLERILQGEENLIDRLANHIAMALAIPRDEVDRLFWESPRSLLLEVVPTLARRLETQWKRVPIDGERPMPDLSSASGVHPLPDFMPPSLFSELNLPEISIRIPPATSRHEERFESMGVVQGMGTLAPGRVTRRFAFERGGLYHWVPVPLDGDEHPLPIGQYAEQYEPLPPVTTWDGKQKIELPCYRLHQVRIEIVSDKDVAPTSNAFLQWRTQLIPAGEGVSFPVPPNSGWRESIDHTEFFLHANQAATTVRRFATASVASVRPPKSKEARRVKTTFLTNEGRPAAVGFEQDVDAVCFALRLPDEKECKRAAAASVEAPAWRTAHFNDLVLHDEVLEEHCNNFDREWLHRVYMAALLREASGKRITLQEARDSLAQQTVEQAFEPIMSVVFGTFDDRNDEASDSALLEGAEGRADHVRGLLQIDEVMGRLHQLAATLWNNDDWGTWLRARTHESLGEALLQASSSLAPDRTGTASIFCDLERMSGDDEQTEVWLTEAAPGGNGTAESLIRAVANNPLDLFTALDAVLCPTDLEICVGALSTVAEWIVTEPEVAKAVADCRSTRDHATRECARRSLLRMLGERGLPSLHALEVALEHRLLRTGLDSDGDEILYELTRQRQQEECRLGVTIELRIFCYLAMIDDSIGPRLFSWLQRFSEEPLKVDEAVGVLSGLLWPTPSEVRGRVLQSYNPFRTQGFTDPALVRDLLTHAPAQRVVYGRGGWQNELQELLATNGRVSLEAPQCHVSDLHTELLKILASPIAVGFLHLQPVLEGAERRGETVTITLRIPDVMST